MTFLKCTPNCGDAMLGFTLYGGDNDSYAFREYPPLTELQRIHQELIPDMSGASRPGVQRCAACGDLLAKWDERLTGLRIRKRRYDISCTYDGVTVVSGRFKAVYYDNQLTGLIFKRLPDDPEFDAIQATEIIKIGFDSRTKFVKQCRVCGRYESVVGPNFALLERAVPDRGFAQTDLEFASGDEKHPILLCGVESGSILRRAKLKGLDLVKI
jgi:hypothetical protein